MIEILDIKPIESEYDYRTLDSIYQELNNRYKSGHVCDSYIEDVTCRFNNEYDRIINDRRERGLVPLYPKTLARISVEFSKVLYGSKLKLG